MANEVKAAELRANITTRRAWLEILLVLVLVGVSGLAAAELALAFAGRLPLPLLLVLQGALVLAGLSMLLARANQRWRDVGLHAIRRADVGRGLLLLGACIGANLILMLVLRAAAPEAAREHMDRLQEIGTMVAGDVPIAAIAATMLFVGVYEELTARGVLLSRCLAALGGVWAPVLLSSILFGLGHAYQGWVGVVQTALIGAILAKYTVAWGTLWPAILAHALLNTISILALRAMEAMESPQFTLAVLPGPSVAGHIP